MGKNMKPILMLRLDTRKSGIDAVFKPYQVGIIQHLVDDGEHGSGLMYKKLLKDGIKISRASVIFFMDSLVAQGLATFREVSGKGGYGKIYKPKYGEGEFNEEIVKIFMLKLNEAFPYIEFLKTVWEDE